MRWNIWRDSHLFNDFIDWEEKQDGESNAGIWVQEEYFIHNGAILLEKQISCNQGRDIETIGVFSAKDIRQAANNYEPDLIQRKTRWLASCYWSQRPS